MSYLDIAYLLVILNWTSFSMKLHLHVLFLLITSASGFILPLTNTKGDTDITNVINHVTLLEQTLNTVQTQLQANTNDMTSLKTRLKAAEDELKIVKSDQKSTVAKLAASESKLQSTQMELNTVKSDLKSAEIELAVLKAGGNSGVQLQTSTSQQLNSTVIDFIGSELKTFGAQLQYLASEVSQNKQYLMNLESSIPASNMSEFENCSCWNQCENFTDVLETLREDLNISVGKLEQDVRKMRTEIQNTRTMLSLTAGEVSNLQTEIMGTTNNFTLNNNTGLLGGGLGFQVSLTKTRNNWNTLMFDKVEYNTDSAYNESSGVFTVPVSGTYLFWANLHVDSNGYGSNYKYVYLKTENRLLATGFTRTFATNKYGRIFITAVVHLDEGEEVFFTTDSITNVIEGGGVSSYGGALLGFSM